jgi:signal transduction histidine kinase
MLVPVQDSRRADRRALVDALIALSFAALSVTLVVGVIDDTGKRVLAVALALGHNTPLALRRRAPLGVLAAMAVTAILTVLLAIPVVVLGPAVLVGVYTVGAQCESRRARQALVAVLVVMAAVVSAGGMRADTVVSDAVALTVAFYLGDRAQRAARDAQRVRAAAADAVRQAAAEERLRIARELHDVVAHAMSVIAVQAGTGRFVIEESPDVARDALATIEATSRDALQEMRRLLSVLRDDEEPSALAPSPTLDDITPLVDVTERAGVRVTVRTTGAPRPLPSGVDLCAYRIVQEALTNVRKHARAAHATVTVSYAPTALELEVVDDGVGDLGPCAAGHGHVGMRERVALYGGSLEVGAANDVGYRVVATFPLAGAR